MYTARYSNEPEGYYVFMLILTILLLLVGPIVGSYMKPAKAEMAMTNSGFTDVQVGQRAEWFVGLRGCGYGDVAMFKIDSAVNPNGLIVENAVVCRGLFQAPMVRYR